MTTHETNFLPSPNGDIASIVTTNDESMIGIASSNDSRHAYSVVSLAKAVMKRPISPIIHYVAYNNRHLVGLITGIDKETGIADLVIFTNMENVNGEKNFGMQFHQKVVRCEDEKRPGTWHAPCADAYRRFPISQHEKEEQHGI